MDKGKPGILRRLFSSTVLLLNIAVVVWLFLCLASAYISPAQLKYISLFSLTTPFAILANLFFVVLWLFSSRPFRSLYSLLTIAACYKIVLTIFAFNFNTKNTLGKKEGSIKIVSWNCHGMGIFNRPKDKAFDERLLNFLKGQEADILVLPEFSLQMNDIMKPYAGRIMRENSYIEYRFKDDNSLNQKVYLGTAVFSKYPFKNYETHQLSQYIFLLQGDVYLPDNRVVRMFFVHLTTFGLSDKDKEYIDEVKNREKDLNSAWNRSGKYIRKFNSAFITRAREADRAAAIIKRSPYPVLICGDFNDLPGSYTYTTLRGKLNDAFLDKGKGLGRSYNAISPTLRIDHMLYDPSILKLVGFDCPKTTLSDHNPIIANFQIIR